jgi:hypothetical protein
MMAGLDWRLLGRQRGSSIEFGREPPVGDGQLELGDDVIVAGGQSELDDEVTVGADGQSKLLSSRGGPLPEPPPPREPSMDNG